MEADTCPVCASRPCVLIAVSHPAMRRLILELLDREHGCWSSFLLAGELRKAVANLSPALVLLDGADFPRLAEKLACFPRNRIVVVGPEPYAAYRAAALRQGAGAWVARDEVGERLSTEMRLALGCRHGPCPAPMEVPEEERHWVAT